MTTKRIIPALVLFICAAVVGSGNRVVNRTGGGGGPTLIASLGEGAPSGGDTFTTSAINTTGANLVAVAKIWYGASEPTLSDSKSNTYTDTTTRENGDTTRKVRWSYVYGGTVGSGHTFTVTGTDNYATVIVFAFSGIASSPLDQQAGNTATSWTTLSSGSITPSQASTVSLTALEFDTGAGTVSVPSTWETGHVVAEVGGANLGGAATWKVLSSTSAVNPDWTSSSAYSVGVTSHINVKY